MSDRDDAEALRRIAALPTVPRQELGAPSQLGQSLDGRYRILEEIGAGGMGAVYRAIQLSVGREVAVKTLLPGTDPESSSELISRFEQEARAVSQLRHPHTLRLIDFGRVGDGELYLVTELLHGQTLEERIEQRAIEPLELVRWLIDTSDALAEAHEKGIIHRDLKPRNLFLDRVGDRELVKILDFGLAKLTRSSTRTAAGLVLGSPVYMSPEQARGGEVTPSSDLYSLGVTAFECLCRAPPFDASSAPAMLLKHLHDRPPRISSHLVSVPPSLDALIDQLLEKKPELRPPSAVALRDRLREIERELTREPPRELGPPRTPVSPRGTGDPDDPLIGARVHNYRVTGLLGAGSVSRVYRATHEVLRRDYALKVLNATGLAHTSVLERLRREAEALSELEHPNIVRVIDFGATAGAFPYLVLELLEGPTLKDVITRDGPLAPARAARIMRQLSSALAHAHQRGLVHRDLKTSNVVLLEDGGEDRVKVLDFGLSRVLDPDGARTALTRKSALLGSPSYMAPEQIESPSTVGPSADLYSLGCVLHAMLSGRPPFSGSVLEILQHHRKTRPAPLPPALGLERLAAWLLEKRPADRPKDAEVVRAELERLEIPGGAPPAEETKATVIRPVAEAPTEGSISVSRPRSAAPYWMSALALVAAGAAGAVLWLKRPAHPEAPAPAPAEKVAPHPIARAAPEEPEPEPEAPAPDPDPAVPAPVPAPVEQKPRRTAAPRVQASLQSTEARLFQAMAARGLSFDDLEAAPSVSGALEAWRKARERRDEAGATEAAERMLTKLGGLRLDAKMVKRKLDRVSRQLQSAAPRLDREQVGALERRFFALATQLSGGSTAVEPEALALELAALEREIARAVSPARE